MSLNVFVSIFVFVIAIVSVFGRIVFVVCGGFGLTSLPISLIKAFIDKPKRIRSDEFLKRKALITSRSEKLLEVGRKLMESHEKGVADRSDKRTYKDFQQATYQLENDWKTLHKSYFDAGGSIIFPFISLICGISLLGLTLLWILHIILYMVAPSPYGPISPFLNSLFMILDSATSEFPMIGALFYTVMTFYLLACVLAGAALLARILPFITVHPLVYRDTMMSSILFNVGLFLFSSVTVNQFATEAFAGYARSTALDTMFGSVIRYLTGIYWVYFLSIYLILAFALVGLVLTGLCWRRKKTEFDNILSSGRLDYDDLTHDAPSPPADPE
jgi:LMBR1 domain-containing protein 1